MTDPATGNVIVVNGEIYNHLAVRAELGPSVDWNGTSDTETLLQGYARWGRDVLGHLKGMFAFAIYDAAREELFFARDRLGIKPLYYSLSADGIRLASEAKMLALCAAGNHRRSHFGLSAMGRLPRTKSSLPGPPRLARRPCHDRCDRRTD